MSDLQPLFGWKTKSNEDSLLKVQHVLTMIGGKQVFKESKLNCLKDKSGYCDKIPVLLIC